MDTICRWLWIGISLGFASAIAVVFLPVAIINDSVLREIGRDFAVSGLETLLMLFISTDDIANVANGIVSIVWIVLVAICVVPVTITGAIGEAAGIRTIAWYSGATGILTGAMPWILRASQGSSGSGDSLAHAAELRFALIFFLTGVVAGTVYWFAAGRKVAKSLRRG